MEVGTITERRRRALELEARHIGQPGGMIRFVVHSGGVDEDDDIPF
jgi:hypothetical protein